MPHTIHATQHQATEWGYASGKAYRDPFNEVELDAIVQHDDGERWRMPAYWAGEQEWCVRFAPPRPGRYTIETACTDATNTDLHGRRATLIAEPYTGDNPLLRHGPLRIAQSKRTFEYADGTPFFWLGDTWWMGLCKRLSWPDDFQRLAADRAAKGFTVIQIVAGLYPDMAAFDPRGANEAGFPWEAGFARINPAYFDMADLRIAWLVRSGLMPCILSCWGYYLPWLGMDKMKQHWRYLIARWSAYPVVWCLAGETAMPYYLSEDKTGDARKQIAGWTEIARYVRATDPYRRLITTHPTHIGRDQVEDDAVLDFDMLQTGHSGYSSVPNTVRTVVAEYKRKPIMPVVVGEANYEGIIHSTQDEVQRLTFWSSILSGAAGYTYGANGIWQVNTQAQPFGPSPHGGTWGNTPWDEAYRLPGSAQLGLARRCLERYPWRQFEAHPEWTDPSGDADHVGAPFAAGIPGQVRVLYFYDPVFPWSKDRITIKRLERDRQHHAFFWDPRTGAEHLIGEIQPDSKGNWPLPQPPTFQDWVVVIESR
ncbi:MAG: DUF4038 domain-containing protein [Candidatus Brachytrichaceae bacterium NZ_4S206]|jgi:hypothetical protein